MTQKVLDNVDVTEMTSSVQRSVASLDSSKERKQEFIINV